MGCSVVPMGPPLTVLRPLIFCQTEDLRLILKEIVTLDASTGVYTNLLSGMLASKQSFRMRQGNGKIARSFSTRLRISVAMIHPTFIRYPAMRQETNDANDGDSVLLFHVGRSYAGTMDHQTLAGESSDTFVICTCGSETHVVASPLICTLDALSRTRIFHFCHTSNGMVFTFE